MPRPCRAPRPAVALRVRPSRPTPCPPAPRCALRPAWPREAVSGARGSSPSGGRGPRFSSEARSRGGHEALRSAPRSAFPPCPPGAPLSWAPLPGRARAAGSAARARARLAVGVSRALGVTESTGAEASPRRPQVDSRPGAGMRPLAGGAEGASGTRGSAALLFSRDAPAGVSRRWRRAGK